MYMYVKGSHLITDMARYRLIADTVETEMGRHTKPKTPHEQRICSRCDTDEIDE